MENQQQITQNNEEEKETEKITYETFSKLILKTATVLEAERIPNSDKLLKLIIDVGQEKRQLVAGIAESYTPEEMIGKQIIIVANLQPRKIRGIESNGMLLAVEENGKIILITTEKKVENGLKVQ